MTWLKQLFSRRRLYTDLSEEIAQHLQQKTAELVSSGMSRGDAELQARREFGNVALIEERSREAWQWPTLESIGADLRAAVRQLRKQPVMALIIILTFGLGIGASTATFSVANAFLFSPLGLPHSESLVVVNEQQGSHQVPASFADFSSWQQETRSFAEMTARTWAYLNLTGNGEPQRLSAARVSANFFHLTGIGPAMGRDFLAAETLAGNDHVVVLSYALWRHRFAADPAIVGRQITLNQQAYTVVGVMPNGFHFPQAVDLWQPLALTDAEKNDRSNHDFVVFGRLKQGVSREQAAAEMDGIAARLAKQHPATNTGVKVRIAPLAQSVNGDLTAAYTRMVLGGTFFVMLVVCANVANLTLARVMARRHEIAVRITLGALRPRILRQLLTESAVLGLLGAIAGIAFAAIHLHLILISMPPEVARYLYSWDQIGLNIRVLGAATLLALASGLGAGLMPALLATGKPSAGMASLSATRTVTDTRHTHRLRNAFAVVQVALALVLVLGAGLLVQGMRRMLAVQHDYSPKTLLTFMINLPASRYGDEQQRGAFYDQALERLKRTAGVSGAGVTQCFPYSDDDADWKDYSVESRPKTPGTFQSAQTLTISPEYLRMMGIPLLQGRFLSPSDGPAAPPAVLINQRLADHLWPRENPLGRRLRIDAWGEHAEWATVAGVVGDVVNGWSDQTAQPTIYVPYRQHPPDTIYFALRTTGDALAMAPAARRAIHDVDADLPVEEVKTYDRFLHESLIGLSYVVVMMAAMGGITLFLGALGIYGVLASGVQERTREIGVRMALGANRADIRRQTLLAGARLFATGAILGLPFALLLAHLLSSLIYGVRTTDLGTLMSTILLAGAVAVLASWLPAMRASSIDPIRALRGE
jgi:putative ABC transport system permease protein